MERFKWGLGFVAALGILCISGGSFGMENKGGLDQEKTLMSLIVLAEKENPQIKAALEKTKQAESEVIIAHSERGPKVNASVGARWNQEKNAGVILDPNSGAVTGVLPSEPRNLYSAALSFSQIVYAGGSLIAGQRAKELGVLASESESLRVFQDVVNGVRQAYFNCYRALEKLGVTEESLRYSKEHLRQAESLHKAGVVPVGDVLRARVAVSQAELNRIRAADDVEVNWVVLERSVGAPLERGDILKPAERVFSFPGLEVSGDILALAFVKRPELTAYESYRKQADQVARGAAGKRLPLVTLGAETSQMSDSFWPRGNDDWSVSMGLQWRLYDHGEIRGQIARARASAKEFLYRIDDLEAQIRLEITRAVLNLQAARARLKVTVDQVKQAEEDHRIAQKRYQAQVGTHLDVLDAQNALIRSRSEYVDAVYDIASSQADIFYAVGVDSPQWVVKKDDASI